MRYTRNTIRYIANAGGWDGIFVSGVITPQFLYQLVIQTGFTARQIQVSIVKKMVLFIWFWIMGQLHFSLLFLLKKCVCHFSILLLWTVLFVEVECTLYRLQMRGNIIIALECVKFWLPQVFHKLFKQREGAGREEVCLSFAYLKDVCFYVQLVKRSHSLLGGREPGDGCMGCQRKIIK